MSSLAELQTRFARAVVDGDAAALARALVGGNDPARRLAIHQRHYEASLTTAVCQRFPACAWLAGSALVTAAARAFVRAHPPRRPCIAEYGGAFPQFLAGRAPELPYLESFAALEWAVGEVALATDAAPLPWSELAALGSERLVDARVTLQPGVRYLRFPSPVDELMELYLTDSAPDRFVLSNDTAAVELHGSRGALARRRLDAGTFAFRAALAAGESVGTAAVGALEQDPSLDPGVALRRLVDAGLVTAAFEGAA